MRWVMLAVLTLGAIAIFFVLTSASWYLPNESVCVSRETIQITNPTPLRVESSAPFVMWLPETGQIIKNQSEPDSSGQYIAEELNAASGTWQVLSTASVCVTVTTTVATITNPTTDAASIMGLLLGVVIVTLTLGVVLIFKPTPNKS